jgi:gliding motility-associated-like protein
MICTFVFLQVQIHWEKVFRKIAMSNNMNLFNRLILAFGKVVSGQHRRGMWSRMAFNLLVGIAVETGLSAKVHAQCRVNTFGYAYKRTITIPKAIGSDLIDFPLLISFTGEDFLKTSMNKIRSSSGFDIFFTDKDNKKLDHQIEYYNGSDGDYVAWVRIPIFSSTTTTEIHMFYGNPQVLSDPSTTSVWSTTYKGVWHLNLNVNDQTTANNTGTNFGVTSLPTGKIAGGQNFGGSAYIETIHNLSDVLNTTSSCSFWINTAQQATKTNHYEWPGITGVEESGGSNDIFYGIINQTGHIGIQPGDSPGAFSSDPINNNTWHYIVLTRDITGSIGIFVDGVMNASVSSEMGSKTTSFKSIGRVENTLEYFNGSLDEFRITNKVISGDWIANEYANQNNPGSFYSVGTETAYSDYSFFDICPNTSVNYSVPDIPGHTFTWNVTGGISVPNANSTNVTWNTSGTIRLIDDDNSGCIVTSTDYTVSIVPLTSANAGVDQFICGSLSTTLAGNNPSSGTGSGVWTLIGGPGSVAFTDANDYQSGISTLQNGTYKFQWQITNGLCSSPDTVIMHFAPYANAGISQHQCNNNINTYTLDGNKPLSGSGKWSVISEPSPGSVAFTDDTLFNTSAAFSSFGSYILNWKITNVLCSSKDTMIMVVDPTIMITASDDTLCNGETTNILPTSVNPGVLGTRYVWTVDDPDNKITGEANSFSDGLSLGDAIRQTLINQDTAAHKIIYHITPWSIGHDHSLHCKGSAYDVTVWVNPTPGIRVLVKDTLCYNEGTTFAIRSSNGSVLKTWVYNETSVADSITGFTNSSDINDGSSIQNLINPTHNIQWIDYTFTPKIKSPRNSLSYCSGGRDTTIRIFINPQPVVNVTLSGNDSICAQEGTSFLITTPNIHVVDDIKYNLSVNYNPAYDPSNITGVAASGLYSVANLDQHNVKNTSHQIQNITYTFTPVIQNAASVILCSGNPVNITLSIAPEMDFILKADTFKGGKNISCYEKLDGKASVQDLKGGFGGYTYAWNNGEKKDSIKNLPANKCKVTITDKIGCKLSDSIVLTRPDQLGAISSIKDIKCAKDKNVGAIEITTKGGTAPYAWQWSGQNNSSTTESIDQLIAGQYSILITDANSCTYTASYDVAPGTEFHWGFSPSKYGPYNPALADLYFYNISCKGRSDGELTAIVDPTAHNLTYSYRWRRSGMDTTTLSTTNTISGVPAGIYSVYAVSSDGCMDTSFYNMLEPDSITFHHTISTYFKNSVNEYNIRCYGEKNGKIEISDTTGGGIGPKQFIWTAPNNSTLPNSLVQNNLAEGKYRLIVHEEYKVPNGPVKVCEVKDSFVLTQPPKLTIAHQISHIYNNYEVACNQGRADTIRLKITGGIAGYTYQWYTDDGIGLNNPKKKNQHNLSAGTYKITVTDTVGCQETTSFALREPNPISIPSFQTTNIRCYKERNGAISIDSVTGGIKPYTYQWSTIDGNITSPSSLIQTGLSEGHYTIGISDLNNCQYFQNFILPPLDSLQIKLITNDISCSNSSDGKIQAVVSGGTAPYSYGWSGPPGYSVSDPIIYGIQTVGLYQLAVTDSKGCFAFAADSVKAPSSLHITPVIASNYNGQNVSCYGASDGIIVLNITGGRAPYTYQWNTSNGSGLISSSKDQPAVSAGNYTVTITDKSGCQGNSYAILTQPTPVSLSVRSTTDILCHSFATGKIAVEGSGGTSPYTYMWSGGQKTAEITKIKAGDYMVTFSDANKCQITQKVPLSEPDSIIAVTEIQKPYCPDATDGEIHLAIEGGIGPYQLLWDDDQTSTTLDHLRPTIYVYRITDMNNCVVRDTIALETRYPACVQISNAFSPNNDTYNDTWEIEAGDPANPVPVKEMYPSAIMEVYTRWGTLVFRSEPGYPSPWDGSYKGRPLPLDSYYYVFNPKNGKRLLKGTVTIVK